MSYRLAATSVVIIGVGLAAAGCGDRSNSAAGPAAAPSAAVVQPEAPPPPTIAAQHETALVEMGAQMKDDGLYVTIPGSTFGGKTKTELASADIDALDRVAGLMKERGELKVAITGYTDNRGKKAANERESLERAGSVRDYLVSRKHVEAERVEVKGVGPADPVASNDSDEGRAQSRRVVLRIMRADGTYESRAALGVHAPTTRGNGSAPQ